MAVLVFAIGLGATLYYWQNLRQSVQADVDSAYKRQAQLMNKAMRERIQLYQNMLRGSAGLISVGKVITQSDWNRFHASYDLRTHHPDIISVGTSRHLSAAEVPAYLERRAGQEAAQFQIFPVGSRDVYAPLTFELPLQNGGQNGTGVARGYDNYTDPVRKAAMDRAVTSNALTMSGRIGSAGQNITSQPSFILYLPVYQSGLPLETIEQRQAALLGFVHMTLDTRRFIEQILDPKNNPHNALEVYDAEAPAGKPGFIYRSDTFAAVSSQPKAVVRSMTSELYGHTWRYTMAVSPDIIGSRAQNLPEQALWRGLITCIFFAGLVWYLITDRERTYARQKQQEVQTAKDDLLSLASHQLRTPATVVKQYVGMLLQGYAGKLTGQQLGMLRNAYESNERQLEIINQLLYVARMDAGRITLHRKTTDVAKLLQEVVRDQQEAAAERKQKLTFRLPKRAHNAVVDPHFMRMVFENLLSNAIKYTPERGSIELSLRRLAGELRVSVKDSGVGVDPKVQATIFDKFTRIENELSTDVNGSGVGLYLTKHIVELHNGSIEVSSSQGRGSEFIVYFPVHPVKQPARDNEWDASGSGKA